MKEKGKCAESATPASSQKTRPLTSQQEGLWAEASGQLLHRSALEPWARGLPLPVLGARVASNLPADTFLPGKCTWNST